jgi:hypothetical protein
MAGPARGASGLRPAISHTAAPRSTSRPAPSAIIGCRLTRGPVGRRTGTVATPDAISGDANASTNRWIEGKRSMGSLAIARMMAASSGNGTVCRTTRRLGTASSECRAMTAWAEGPVNGGWPISTSYRVHARLY